MEHSIASEIAFITAHPIRLIGDLLHLASFVILFLKIQSRHSCAGTARQRRFSKESRVVVSNLLWLPVSVLL